MSLLRRPVLAAAATAAAAFALFASATAASASTLVIKQSELHMYEVVTDCPNNGTGHLGEECHVWTVEATAVLATNGTVTKSVQVVGYLVQVTNVDGTVAGGTMAGGTATTGTIKGGGKTGKLAFTVAMTCLSPGCPLGGPTKFNLSLSIGSKSFFSSSTGTFVNASTSCVITTTNVHSEFGAPKVRGTVKFGGKLKSVHDYVKDSSSGTTFDSQHSKQVAKPVCS